MKIINNSLTTYLAMDNEYTSAKLSRLIGNVTHTIHIKAKHFTMQKMEQFCNLDDNSFIGLSDIQAKRKELENDTV